MNGAGPEVRPAGILVVCTANRCRSPVAAELLRRRFAASGVAVDVASAGIRGRDEPMPAEGVAALAERGIDLSAHRSSLVTVDAVSRADVVVGMARLHVREVAAADPAAWPRTFTLKGLVRRGQAVGSRYPGERVADWLGAVGRGRPRNEILGDSPDDDVFDPIGQGATVWNAVIDEIDRLTGALVGLLDLPPVRDRVGVSAGEAP